MFKPLKRLREILGDEEIVERIKIQRKEKEDKVLPENEKYILQDIMDLNFTFAVRALTLKYNMLKMLRKIEAPCDTRNLQIAAIEGCASLDDMNELFQKDWPHEYDMEISDLLESSKGEVQQHENAISDFSFQRRVYMKRRNIPDEEIDEDIKDIKALLFTSSQF